MIAAKTGMKRIPESCRWCNLSWSNWFGERFCSVTNGECPKEYEKNGSWMYIRPDWCPLMEMEENYDA